MTCGWAAFTLGGPAMREVFMRSSSLDVRESRFPAGRCMTGSVMRAGTIVLNEGDRFRMLVNWEVGEYFWDAILDAGVNFGIAPVSASVALREGVAV
jgi:sarcosine oxidase gamma subunit